MKRLAATLLLAFPLFVGAQDVLLLKNGDRRSGDIISADDTTIRLRVPLGDGTLPGAATASVGIPRADVESIEFKADPEREARLRTATPASIFQVEIDWKRQEPWLAFPRSPAGSIGCRLGELLLDSKDPAKAATAIDLFTLIEEKSWSDQDKARAKQGRLRAMVATGRALEAIEQAKQLAQETEDPQILIEANYIMAQAAEKDLRAFLDENPRWDIDSNVIDQRHELYNKALELYLYPALFHGSDNVRAARGLWGATAIHKMSAANANEAGNTSLAKTQTALAIELARDITTLHPDTAEAKLAQEYLDGLPPEDLASDFEAQARKDMEDGITESPATSSAPAADKSEAPPAPEPSPKKKPWTKN
ncbi:MAG: hypothetical protein ACKOAS_09955 [Verrucomicrobiota bacterium]